MSTSGLLVVSNPIKIAWLLHMVQNQVRKSLYIQLYPGWHLVDSCSANENLSSCGNKYIAQLGHLVTGIYTQATAICHHLDIRILLSQCKSTSASSSVPHEAKRKVDVIFYDKAISTSDIAEYVASSLETSNLVALDPKSSDKTEDEICKSLMQRVSDCQPKDTDCQYNHVVLGGTFDRLHNGHKELLSQAIIRCKSKLTVGVTDATMIKSKVLHELVEPCDVRIEKVRKFLQDVDSTLEYNVVPIGDPFGPTKDDPTMDMIVVSAETKRGGDKVNELRASNGLGKLQLHCIELLEDQVPKHLRDIEGEDWKISSSSARIRLLGTKLKEPQFAPDLPTKPYVIGLTGGIASGKSAIGDRLERLGAGIINCDLLGHEVYLPGTKGYDLIIKEFGPEIVASDGYIDRKALGKIVFSNKACLEKLNSLVWPLMLEMVEERLIAMRDAGITVAIVEAAVLTRAGWDKRCHEVWAVIVPPDEAIRRLQERNGLSEEECKNRLAAQLSNDEHVAKAHVVFSPSWSPIHTQQQVQRAWQQLQDRLPSSAHL